MSRGFVKITFDCLLSNFFSKALVRLCYMHSSSVADCSRRHFVVHIPESQRQNGISSSPVGWSLCCVVEDKMSNSLIVYPGGSSIDATSITHQAIRRLLDESFSGMTLKEVEVLVGRSRCTREDIVGFLKNPNIASDYSEIEIVIMKSIGCLFVELDHKLSQSLFDLTSLSLPSNHIQTLSTLLSWSNQYEKSKEKLDRFNLSEHLIKTIPIFREYGLNLSPHPKILWLVGKSIVQSQDEDKDNSKENYHLLGLSPSRVPSEPWEIVVWESNIVLHSESHHYSHHRQNLSSLSELLLASLRLLLPGGELPSSSSEPIEWIGLKQCDSQRDLISQHESQLFVSEPDTLGEFVYFSKLRSKAPRGDDQAPIDYANTLFVSYSNIVVKVDINQLRTQVSSHLLDVEVGWKIEKVLSIEGLNVLLLGHLNEIALLQIAMTTDSRIEMSLKRQLLFGLLLKVNNNLIVIREGKRIVSPLQEMDIPNYCLGKIKFTRFPPSEYTPNAPTLADLYEMKKVCHQPVWKIIGLILIELMKLPPRDSLLDQFRLKSYASVMNKLFYRGKGLSDLFAATATTYDQFKNLKEEVENRGGVLASESRNGNGFVVYRYARLLEVRINNSSDDDENESYQFTLSIHYEIVYKTSAARTTHEQYELERLKFELQDKEKRDRMDLLTEMGFTVEKTEVNQNQEENGEGMKC